jgi:hypothetical protein
MYYPGNWHLILSAFSVLAYSTSGIDTISGSFKIVNEYESDS